MCRYTNDCANLPTFRNKSIITFVFLQMESRQNTFGQKITTKKTIYYL